MTKKNQLKALREAALDAQFNIIFNDSVDADSLKPFIELRVAGVFRFIMPQLPGFITNINNREKWEDPSYRTVRIAVLRPQSQLSAVLKDRVVSVSQI